MKTRKIGESISGMDRDDILQKKCMTTAMDSYRIVIINIQTNLQYSMISRQTNAMKFIPLKRAVKTHVGVRYMSSIFLRRGLIKWTNLFLDYTEASYKDGSQSCEDTPGDTPNDPHVDKKNFKISCTGEMESDNNTSTETLEETGERENSTNKSPKTAINSLMLETEINPGAVAINDVYIGEVNCNC